MHPPAPLIPPARVPVNSESLLTPGLPFLIKVKAEVIMPVRLWLALVLLPWCASTALAGAWPRERGQVFLSFSSQVEERDELHTLQQTT